MKRIYHTWDKWECYPAGFYETRPPKGMTTGEAKQACADFLSDIPRFRQSMAHVQRDWPRSCEHYLSNENMNRIAFLGQSAMCHATGISQMFCGGYQLLTEAQQQAADEAALLHLNMWLSAHGEPPVTMEEAYGKTKANLY